MSKTAWFKKGRSVIALTAQNEPSLMISAKNHYYDYKCRRRSRKEDFTYSRQYFLQQLHYRTNIHHILKKNPLIREHL
ncbi:MAG: hypothetical protein DCF15_03155 [Phormidesmis priestleyi]|uniref:Uncharacterized protein n=1 Tax=Phormidesmis priestleyi TaxID=268141 RepID=A0A2W4XVR5_9CYAN|nr:MAG: hypothetical protein DCF15_03155 [Phormidesmis priestleyi]